MAMMITTVLTASLEAPTDVDMFVQPREQLSFESVRVVYQGKENEDTGVRLERCARGVKAKFKALLSLNMLVPARPYI